VAEEIKTLVILGPTAAGKSALAIEKARELNGEIISADSMQVYRGLDIGTAKLTEKERQGIPHHLIDIRNPDQEWTVSDFVNECNQRINELENKRKIPIIVGGTGLYLWAWLKGFSFPISPADKDLRAHLEKEPLAKLYSRLSTVDPAAAQKIHPNDKKRIIRALEVFELTGKPISELQEKRITKEPRINSRLNLTANSFAGSYQLIGLSPPRETLYARIEQRVDDMIRKGLVEEVKGLLNKGYSKNLNSMQALGYKETVEYLEGRWTKEKMIEELKKRTRNFAKRQMTWFRRFGNVDWRAS
jgi:tRNA dimethylallyltransferase